MTEPEPKSLQEIVAATRYSMDAFHFIRRGLDYTVHRVHSNPEQLPEGQRHVDGAQLSEGLREFAVDQYGCLAKMVLKRWNVCRTEDFGHIVFAMVEGGLMQANQSDTVADFDAVYDFEAAFDVPVSVSRVPEEGFEPDAVQNESS